MVRGMPPEEKPLQRREASAWTVVLGASLLILILAWPAFSGFFMGEDFIYWGFYVGHQYHLLPAVMAPLSGVFFRPVVAAWNILFQSVLPVDPFAHHVRNWATTVIAVALLYLLMLRLVPSFRARLAGMALFAFSKVHLTTIGYVNCNDSIMSLIQLLATLHCLTLYFQTGRAAWLGLTYIFFALEVFSRDYGVVVFGIALCVYVIEMARPRRFEWRPAAFQIAGFFAVALVYFGVRKWVVGSLPLGQGPDYPVSLDLHLILNRAWIFAGNVFNFSLSEAQVTGVGSYATWLASVAPRLVLHPVLWDRAVLIPAVAIFCGTVLFALREDGRLVVPLVWVAAFIGPTFLIRNLQVYYILEPIAGLALLLAMALNASRLRSPVWTGLWALILLICGINTAVQNQHVRMYAWRFCADAAEKAYREVIQPNVGRPLKSLTLLVADPRQVAFWDFTLTADTNGPMVPRLLGNDAIPFKVAGLDRWPAPEALISAESPVFLVSENHFIHLLPPVLKRVVPSGTRAGQGFNVQPSGQAALWIDCENALPSTAIVWRETSLPTAFGNSHALSALVPAEFYARPARVKLYLKDRLTGLQSNVEQFTVSR